MLFRSREGSHDGELDWTLIEDAAHSGVLALMRDLNQLYRRESALHALDARADGFQWIEAEDRERSIFAFLRLGGDGARPILVAVNMTPVARASYRVGVSRAGFWSELLNTDSAIYGGSNAGNFGGALTHETPSHGEAHALELFLPAFSAIVLRCEGAA